MSIAATLKGIVMSLPGVEAVEVRYDEGMFDVTYDSSKITPEEIIKKIGQERGIAVRVVESASS